MGIFIVMELGTKTSQQSLCIVKAPIPSCCFFLSLSYFVASTTMQTWMFKTLVNFYLPATSFSDSDALEISILSSCSCYPCHTWQPHTTSSIPWALLRVPRHRDLRWVTCRMYLSLADGCSPRKWPRILKIWNILLGQFYRNTLPCLQPLAMNGHFALVMTAILALTPPMFCLTL